VLFSEVEYQNLVQPLLAVDCVAGDAAERERHVALVAFSLLCEPSDRLPALLAEHIALPALLELLIARADGVALTRQLGANAAAEIEDALQDSLANVWQQACERWIPRLNKDAVLRALTWMGMGASGIAAPHRLVLKDTDAYPLGLNDLANHQPPVLWCVGDTDLLLREAAVAIVGTRQASLYGSNVTRDLGAVAAAADVVTVSGGAFGIDAIVHQSAIQLAGPTMAVMAGGLGRLYPRSNLQLLEQVGVSGLLLSEVPPDVAPAKWRFLMRNRLIAALGRATVVVEAGRTSGAISTANHALTLGREVAVVPGSIESSRSTGCHDFLNNNPESVRLLARPQQLIELAGLGNPADLLAESANLGRLEVRALDTFGNSLLQAWEVQRLAGLTVRETQIALGSLESLGLVKRVGVGYRRFDAE
jgi:DNA processing protein